MQEAQWQAAKANLVPCHNCERRFAPDRIAVHERVCKSSKNPLPTAVRDNYDDDEVVVKRQYQAENTNSQNNNKDRRTPGRENMSRRSEPVSQRTTPRSVEFDQSRSTPRDQQKPTIKTGYQGKLSQTL